MLTRPPYVVVVTAPSSGVGKSTMASNLAVYLKGLAEDLPVAYLSLDSRADCAAMFVLPGRPAGRPVDLARAGSPPDYLQLGEFGVEYCQADPQSGTGLAPEWLRKSFAQGDYDGVLILDVAYDQPLAAAALWAADLLLVPIKDPAALGSLAAIRKEFVAGGGSEAQLCLLPSELGAQGPYQGQASLLDFLRFAAEERGFQVLSETLVADSLVRQQAAELAKPVLTRVPQSPLHQQLRQLAEFVLQQRRQQNSYLCRIERWRRDGQLPARARRVDLVCPVCQQGVLFSQVQYLESYPARQRLLVHCSCISALLAGSEAGVFQATTGALLIQAGAAQGGSAGELRLQALDPELELLSSELLRPGETSGWQPLLQRATGRCLTELYREVLLVSPSMTVTEALSPDWYMSFVQLRRRLRRVWQRETI